MCSAYGFLLLPPKLILDACVCVCVFAVVCGDQSAGKSSVLQRITGIELPRAAGTCTRAPMEVNLRRAPPDQPWRCQVSLRRVMHFAHTHTRTHTHTQAKHKCTCMHVHVHKAHACRLEHPTCAARCHAAWLDLCPWCRFKESKQVAFGDVITDKSQVQERLKRAQLAILHPGEPPATHAFIRTLL